MTKNEVPDEKRLRCPNRCDSGKVTEKIGFNKGYQTKNCPDCEGRGFWVKGGLVVREFREPNPILRRFVSKYRVVLIGNEGQVCILLTYDFKSEAKAERKRLEKLSSEDLTKELQFFQKIKKLTLWCNRCCNSRHFFSSVKNVAYSCPECFQYLDHPAAYNIKPAEFPPSTGSNGA